MKPGFPMGGWPSIGAVVSKLQGAVDSALPPFISLSPPNAESTTRASLNQPGFLGVGHAGFEPNRTKRNDIVYRSGVSKEQTARDREEVMQGVSEQSLEKFRRWIERYYKALADGDEQ